MKEVGVFTQYREVTASRGKHIRAEPLSALYEQGRIRHALRFEKAEDEMLGFSTTGYTGQRSPNRGDAIVIAFTELFPTIALHTDPRPAYPEFSDGYEFDYDDEVDLARVV